MHILHFLVFYTALQASFLSLQGLLEEWTAKAPTIQDMNSKGSALCTLISVLTSPAKARMHHKSGIPRDYYYFFKEFMSTLIVPVSVQGNVSSMVLNG